MTLSTNWRHRNKRGNWRLAANDHPRGAAIGACRPRLQRQPRPGRAAAAGAGAGCRARQPLRASRARADAAAIALLPKALLARRAQGEPVAYILGRRGFYDIDLRVTPATLIPRPETELLLEEALRLSESLTEATVADIGTGSGALAIAFQRRRPGLQSLCHRLLRRGAGGRPR